MLDSDEPTLGQLLRRYRNERGWTREELAEKAKVSVDTIDTLEREIHPTARQGTLKLLMDALGLSDDERAQCLAANRRGRARSRPAKQARCWKAPSP
jgi:transcriptional regulator with XRE-family HTH domain